MNPISKDEIYQTALADILVHLPRTEQKLIAWNGDEMNRVKELSELMKGAADGITHFRQSIVQIEESTRCNLNDLKAIHRRAGESTDVATLKLALGSAIETIERMRSHQKTSFNYVIEMDRRVKLVNHKLDVQTVHIQEHAQIVDNHFAFLDTTLAVLDGQKTYLDHHVLALIASRLRVRVERIVTVVYFIFGVILGYFLLELFRIWGILTGV